MDYETFRRNAAKRFKRDLKRAAKRMPRDIKVLKRSWRDRADMAHRLGDRYGYDPLLGMAAGKGPFSLDEQATIDWLCSAGFAERIHGDQRSQS